MRRLQTYVVFISLAQCRGGKRPCQPCVPPAVFALLQSVFAVFVVFALLQSVFAVLHCAAPARPAPLVMITSCNTTNQIQFKLVLREFENAEWS